MALTTYTELKAAIATRLNRSNMTSVIVDCVTMAEHRLNRLVKLAAQETETTLTATQSSRSISLPSLFGSPIALYLTTYTPRNELVYLLPTQMQAYADNGQAKYWTIDGAVLKTDRPADLAYTYALRYRAKYDLASTETNALLTNYPDLYFYGALMEAADQRKDEKDFLRYQVRFEQAMQECWRNENKSRSLATLRTELAPAGKSNIVSGD